MGALFVVNVLGLIYCYQPAGIVAHQQRCGIHFYFKPQKNKLGYLNMSLSPFHLAIPVDDLPAARRFYGDVFGLEEGRSSAQWVDFNFYGHQLVIHEIAKTGSHEHASTNPVDGHDVPVPHFGIVLDWDQWEALAERLKSFGIKFIIEPGVRFKGQVGEQATMFLLDPCGNALEFKAFKDTGQLFAK
tara:strand:+ start:2250 stop:2810 length:561 start_codon:yes stop_codon:yes gene_type:complete